MTTFTARTPEDILAAVAVVLGFHPEESAVLLTFGAGDTFHARTDLPPPGARPEEIDDMVDLLLDPCVRHGVRRFVLVIYAADVAGAAPVALALERAFAEAGIETVDMLGADGSCWVRLGRGGPHPPGAAYDVTTHRFLVESVVDGIVTHGSRAELAATVAPDRAAAERVRARLGRPVSAGEAVVAVERHTAAGTVPPDAELAGLLVPLLDRPVRDAVLMLADRRSAASHVRFWTDLVRRAPPELSASPAALLAMNAWVAGQGALAWCALDRLHEVDPEHGLGLLVAELLTRAVPPTLLEEVRIRMRAEAEAEPG